MYWDINENQDYKHIITIGICTCIIPDPWPLSEKVQNTPLSSYPSRTSWEGTAGSIRTDIIIYSNSPNRWNRKSPSNYEGSNLFISFPPLWGWRNHRTWPFYRFLVSENGGKTPEDTIPASMARWENRSSDAPNCTSSRDLYDFSPF